mgnify:CR=1 FL=1
MRIERIVPRRGINDENKGKKHALYRLISASTADYVWLQDDDIVPPTATEEEALCAIGDADMLILPLRMEPETAKPSLLERLQIAEYAAIQQLTLETAARGHAVMCSGANLIVRRECWIESYADLHPDIPSGDDMFLLESFKRRGLKIKTLSLNTQHSTLNSFTATVRPQTSWRTFFRQRMRWAGKAPAYTDRDILLCGTWVAATNILQFLCPPAVLLKFPFDYALIRRREPTVSLGIAFLLALLYPYYMLICLVGGIVRTHTAKAHVKTW